MTKSLIHKKEKHINDSTLTTTVEIHLQLYLYEKRLSKLLEEYINKA
jgi:hypothetical protein